MRMLRKVSAAHTTGCKPEIHREARGKTFPMSPEFLCLLLIFIHNHCNKKGVFLDKHYKTKNTV